MPQTDTIAAVATPPGRGGVGIIRVSGPKARKVAEALLGGCPAPRQATYLPFYDSDNATIDQGIAIFFKAPFSFTGEDVLELQGHGGPVVLDMLLSCVVKLGVRLAQPGEFSQRAFLNDKLDLAQAEAIADLIDSSSVEAARSALRSLQGEFSAHIQTLVEALIRLRIYVEAAIDFPEEEVDFLADSAITEQLQEIIANLKSILAQAQQGCLLREGMNVVIAGQPNAGKSSLLNRLAQRELAIVTDIAGTTRDTLRHELSIDGLPIHIIDTAGLRESNDTVEQIGIQRAWREIEQADRILLLVNNSDGITAADQAIIERLPNTIAVTVIRNKIDLSNGRASISDGALGKEIALSAKTGSGLELLTQHLKECVGYQSAGEGSFMARRRHVDALQRGLDLVLHGQQQLLLHQAGELLAEDLRQAQDALNEITGEFSSDDLLGKIFSSFCIGK
ncbi:MAG: tRNA uridine-5-carboxymethylaminomethyl(34) synthesis GTPase MnmE [Pseudomonadota bacterium]|nr:tRNA uridine-5-carboxymethylaminomethyl(34) synthesis GTPase MnmE [Pseudomonadota bacterium]